MIILYFLEYNIYYIIWELYQTFKYNILLDSCDIKQFIVKTVIVHLINQKLKYSFKTSNIPLLQHFCSTPTIKTSINVIWNTITFNINCTLYTVNTTLYTVHYTLYTVNCTMFTVHCTMYSKNYMIYIIHKTQVCFHWIFLKADSVY